jgi:glyoxylase-like metal-dependent hydrolase (beta-lactamase superfamily II)
VSARPAALPLPGGAPGATVALHPLRCASVTMPAQWAHRQHGLRGALSAFGVGVPEHELLRAPIVAYLIEHPRAGPILVDTGFPADVITDRRHALGAINAMIFRGVRMRAEDTVAAQLSARGIRMQDVGLIIMTHLHVDHSGGLADFPGATVLVGEPEWHAARARTSGCSGYRRAHLDPALEYRLLRFATPPAAGLARLEQALDVFGDGSLRLLATPGHTAGHMSVLLGLRDRDALLAGDATYTMATLREGQRAFRTVDRAAYEQSVRMLAAYDRAHPRSLVIPGHDAVAWAALQSSYR